MIHSSHTIVVRITDSEIQLSRSVFGKVIGINIIGRNDIVADENNQPKNAVVCAWKCVLEAKDLIEFSEVSQTSRATSLTIHSFRSLSHIPFFLSKAYSVDWEHFFALDLRTINSFIPKLKARIKTARGQSRHQWTKQAHKVRFCC